MNAQIAAGCSKGEGRDSEEPLRLTSDPYSRQTDYFVWFQRIEQGWCDNNEVKSIATLANTFSSFFNEIPVIRSSLPSDSHSRVLNPPDIRNFYEI